MQNDNTNFKVYPTTSGRPLIVGLPTFDGIQSNASRYQSFVERYDAKSPRIARYFYGLTLRDLGDVTESAKELTYTFEPNITETEEFPELFGVMKVILTIPLDGSSSNQIRLEYGFGVFCIPNKRKPEEISIHSMPYDKIEHAFNFLDVTKDLQGFYGAEPYVASFQNPLQKLERPIPAI